MTEWLANLAAQAQTITPAVVVPAGAVIALIVIGLIWRSLRKQKPDRIAVGVAVLLASSFSAQGMYEVATTRLHLPWYLASGLFVVAEAAMLASAVRAHRHWAATRGKADPGSLGPHQTFIWTIAGFAGLIVSLTARSAPEYLLRLLMPMLVAGLWRMGYVSPKTKRRAADAISFAWSPRRIGIRLGIIEPGDEDLVQINAERHIRRLTTHAHAVHHGLAALRWWHAGRLRKLTLLSTDEMVAEVQARVTRVHYVESSTAPAQRDIHSGALPGRWWRPWSRARQIAAIVEQLRVERSAEQLERAEAERFGAAALHSMQTRVEETERRSAEALQSARADAERAIAAALERTRAEHATALERLRVEHAEQLAVERSRTPRFSAPRSTPRPARTMDQSDGAERRYNAVLMSDAEAIKAMLALHDAPNYQWSQGEVQGVAGCGVTRSKRLISMVAEHHRRAAEPDDSGDGDQEHQLAAFG